MKILGMVWVRIQTPKLKEMDVFCEEILGLERRAQIPGVVEAFNLPNGDVFEVMSPGFDEWDWRCPKADFLVDVNSRAVMSDRFSAKMQYWFSATMSYVFSPEMSDEIREELQRVMLWWFGFLLSKTPPVQKVGDFGCGSCHRG